MGVEPIDSLSIFSKELISHSAISHANSLHPAKYRDDPKTQVYENYLLIIYIQKARQKCIGNFLWAETDTCYIYY